MEQHTLRRRGTGLIASDLDRANSALDWVESKESDSGNPAGSSTHEQDHIDSRQSLPYDWDSGEATSEAWSGADESMAEYLASALRENGIPSRIPDEPDHRARLCVRPADLRRAREIVAQIADGASPK